MYVWRFEKPSCEHALPAINWVITLKENIPIVLGVILVITIIGAYDMGSRVEAVQRVAEKDWINVHEHQVIPELVHPQPNDHLHPHIQPKLPINMPIVLLQDLDSVQTVRKSFLKAQFGTVSLQRYELLVNNVCKRIPTSSSQPDL